MNNLVLLNSEERLDKVALNDIIGGKRRLKATVKIEICYVETPDTTAVKSVKP